MCSAHQISRNSSQYSSIFGTMQSTLNPSPLVISGKFRNKVLESCRLNDQLPIQSGIIITAIMAWIIFLFPQIRISQANLSNAKLELFEQISIQATPQKSTVVPRMHSLSRYGHYALKVRYCGLSQSRTCCRRFPLGFANDYGCLECTPRFSS